jgi:hypothetical protein
MARLKYRIGDGITALFDAPEIPSRLFLTLLAVVGDERQVPAWRQR